ncbi:unnamed protein product [Nesidiocoris tenuis]|uniref:Uncharacterized protein n=1 Tax=Nesidiocoris tenuis TaxID=355587 RepID=A0A6H5G6E6_9HEMI|nr:unnamed protein product [Nesidiocoris tenuis]
MGAGGRGCGRDDSSRSGGAADRRTAESRTERKTESAESTKLLCESLEREKFDLESALRSIKAQNAELLKERESSKNVSTEHEMVIAKLKEAMETLTDEKVSAVLRSVEIEETLGAREKEIAILKDSLRILEAEKVETSRQSGAHPDGDSELMSDYNMSNGLQVKLTVLQNELDNYRERERVLQESRDELEAKLREICGERDALKAKVGSIRKDDDAKKLEESLAERDQTNNELQAKLGRVCQNLAQQEEQCATLRSQLDAVVAEKEKLLRALSEKGAMKETTQPSTGQPSTSDPDTTVQKLKKLAAMYKKKCGELEGEVEQLKATLNKKNDDCSVLASERSCLEHDVLNQASRYQQTFNEMQRLETELAELYSFVNEFKNVANDSLSQIVDPRRVAEALAMMSAWSSRTGTALPPSSYMPQSCITSDIEELRRILSEKQAAIQELEKDKNELGDLVSANQQELELLKELYEKEAAKNEKFYADLMGLEGEMSQSKSDLLARLEEVTSALQGRENYIEILEQDIVNMKTKMFSIESGMDDKHRELKDRAQLMLSKLEEAELMSQTFDKYKNEVENKIKSLKESEEKTKSQLIDAQVALESSQEEIEATRLRNSILENEKEQLSAKVSEMEGELETLRDIRNAYNNTLDTIEELNGGLKEAMDGFVAKSEKLDRIESERQVLINKLTDLEDAFGDLEKKLELSERANILLQGNSEQLARQMTEAQKELDSLRANQAGTDLLQKELSELSGSYDEKISVLELSKQKLEQLLTVKSQEIETLQVNWQQAETALRLSCDSRIAEVEASSRAQIQSALAELESLRQSRPAESSMQSSQTSPLPEPSRKNVAAAGESFENPFDDEDGWGWSGGENAAQPDAGEVSLLQESSRIAELMSSIQSLRSEKDRAVEELEAMKLNYKKVLKKLKDMKAEKAKPSSSGFSDLDLAVQEELRSENDALQGKLADLTKQFDSLKREKESLSKRVDTLVSANEQLIDMKERQDIEVQMWQKRSTELTNQVQNLQWSLEGMSSEGGNDPELALKINALAAENEELKSILNGHRDEMDRALAREQDLEQEILDLKGQLAELEKSAVKDQKPAASVGSAAAFFQQPGMVADGQQLKVQVESLLAENQKMKTTVEEKDREIRTAIDQVSELEQKLASLEIAGKSSIEHRAPAPTAAPLFQAVVEEPRKPEDALENEKLRIELNDLKNQLSQNSVREQELQLEIEQLKNQVATRITEMEEVRVQKTTPISTSQTLPGSDPELLRKFDALTLENDDLKRMLNEMKTEISQIEGREKLLQQEVNRLKNAGTAAPALPVQSAAMLFQGSAQPFVDVFDSLSSNLAPAPEPHSSIIETDASHQELQQKLEALANENGRLLQKIEDDASRILNFESQVSSQKAYFDEQVKELEQNFQKALMERDEDNAHLVCSVSAKEQALKNATKELQAVRDQFKNVAEIKAKLEEYERENANLRSKLDGLKNYLEVSREAAENEHLSAMGPLKNQISILEEAKAKIVALLKSKESEIEAYQRDLQAKEQNLRELNQQLQFYHQEVERLKSQSEPNLDESNVLAEIDRLSAAVGELQTTIKNQQEQLGDKDRIILELQHEIRVLQSVSDSAYTSSGEEERLQYSVSFLESERQRLENLVQDRLSEVAKYDQELEQLRKAASQSGSSASADISTCAAQIEEKDREINRLTKAVVEIQERLLLSEQGKLNPDLKVVQNKLDQALYALHARDLKIEEMTLEIMQVSPNCYSR